MESSRLPVVAFFAGNTANKSLVSQVERALSGQYLVIEEPDMKELAGLPAKLNKASIEVAALCFFSDEVPEEVISVFKEKVGKFTGSLVMIAQKGLHTGIEMMRNHGLILIHPQELVERLIEILTEECSSVGVA